MSKQRIEYFILKVVILYLLKGEIFQAKLILIDIVDNLYIISSLQ